jgi:hypothetical protein
VVTCNGYACKIHTLYSEDDYNPFPSLFMMNKRICMFLINLNSRQFMANLAFIHHSN